MKPKRNKLHPLLRSLDPSPIALLQWLAGQLTDWDLRAIAAADYRTDEEEYFATLKRIQLACLVGDDSQCEMSEVLMLTKCSDAQDRRAHVKRAFACAVLLRANAAIDSHTGQAEYAVAPLVESAIFLGPQAAMLTLRYYCWHLPHASPLDAERVYVVLGIFILAVHLRSAPELLEPLCVWVREEQQAARHSPYPIFKTSNQWLIGLGPHIEIWEQVTRRVLLGHYPHLPSPLQAELKALGKRILLK
jgi:hypothetical protein